MTDAEHEIEELKKLKEATDTYLGAIFDWVSPLKQQHILSHLYDLQFAIKERTDALTASLAKQDN